MIFVYISLILLIVFLGAIMFFVFPSGRKHSDISKLEGLFIAHRGLHKNDEGIPENSLKAFSFAIEKGFAIENDIHLTADGEVVVFHDDNLKRMCGTDKIIEEMTLEEIKSQSLLNSEEKIPTLRECLELIDGRVPLLIEFKCKSVINCKELCEAADNILKDYKGEYFVQSFYPMVLKWYRKNRPDLLRGQLADSFKGEEVYKRMLGNMLFNFISRPDFVSYQHSAKNKKMFRLVKKLGVYPVGWTFRTREDIDNCKKDFGTYIFENFIP